MNPDLGLKSVIALFGDFSGNVWKSWFCSWLWLLRKVRLSYNLLQFPFSFSVFAFTLRVLKIVYRRLSNPLFPVNHNHPDFLNATLPFHSNVSISFVECCLICSSRQKENLKGEGTCGFELVWSWSLCIGNPIVVRKSSQVKVKFGNEWQWRRQRQLVLCLACASGGGGFGRSDWPSIITPFARDNVKAGELKGAGICTINSLPLNEAQRERECAL